MSKNALNSKYFSRLTSLAQSGADADLARHLETLTVIMNSKRVCVCVLCAQAQAQVRGDSRSFVLSVDAASSCSGLL